MSIGAISCNMTMLLTGKTRPINSSDWVAKLLLAKGLLRYLVRSQREGHIHRRHWCKVLKLLSVWVHLHWVASQAFPYYLVSFLLILRRHALLASKLIFQPLQCNIMASLTKVLQPVVYELNFFNKLILYVIPQVVFQGQTVQGVCSLSHFKKIRKGQSVYFLFKLYILQPKGINSIPPLIILLHFKRGKSITLVR